MITNVGALRDRTLRNVTDDDFGLVVTSHLRGTFTCGRAAAANAVIPTALTRTVATMPRVGDLVAKADAGEPIPEGARRQVLGSPDDVAPLILYLASEESDRVTGQAIAVGEDRVAPITCYADTDGYGWHHVDLFLHDSKGREPNWVHWQAPVDVCRRDPKTSSPSSTNSWPSSPPPAPR
ncbi:hypothetical protein WB401_08055 [Streptomyces brasiliscabiei]|uniref:Uncharacterized protein n=2 Tax=Streptomyces brasiliscabiei TaxID=2736302 RepID=A0ABU8G616_9ACTN